MQNFILICSRKEATIKQNNPISHWDVKKQKEKRSKAGAPYYSIYCLMRTKYKHCRFRAMDQN
jgi:hypothetical protein